MVTDLFRQEKYPEDVEELPGKDVILRCWRRQYATAQDVVDDLLAAGFGTSYHEQAQDADGEKE